MEVQEAFDTLLKVANTELEKVQQQGAAYFASGDTAHVREAADQVERIQGVIQAVEQLKDLWEKVMPKEAPVKETQTIADVHQQALPILNPPMVKKQPIIQRNSQSKRASSQAITPREDYKLPILKILSKHDGSWEVKAVLDELERIFKDRFTPLDLKSLPEGGQIRWRNSAQWARNEMVHTDGYLSTSSPHGIWEITQKGKAYLEKNVPSILSIGKSPQIMSNQITPILPQASHLPNFWWITANPNEWKWDELYKSQNTTEFFTIRKKEENFRAAKVGDLVFGYQASPTRMLVAMAYVSKSLHDWGGRKGIEITRIGEHWLIHPIRWHAIRTAIPDSEPVQCNAQGTLFRLAVDEAQILARLISRAENKFNIPEELKFVQDFLCS